MQISSPWDEYVSLIVAVSIPTQSLCHRRLPEAPRGKRETVLPTTHFSGRASSSSDATSSFHNIDENHPIFLKFPIIIHLTRVDQNHPLPEIRSSFISRNPLIFLMASTLESVGSIGLSKSYLHVMVDSLDTNVMSLLYRMSSHSRTSEKTSSDMNHFCPSLLRTSSLLESHPLVRINHSGRSERAATGSGIF